MIKSLLTMLLSFIGVTTAFSQATNYTVSTEPTTRGALLEEFTGIHCGFCPQGHAIAKKMLRNHSNIYTIAIHSGHYAVNNRDEPNFRTEEGAELDSYYQPDGYPSGMVNRARFGGSSPIMSRSVWPDEAKALTAMDAPVNLLATARYDGSDRSLSIHVEGYFTAEEQLQDQELMVVWTQSNILGPQNGANMGDDYSHQHMLRQYVTPLWGDTLQSPAKGTYFARDYTITLPEELNDVEVVPADIDILAFVSNGKDEIQNVTGCKPSYTNYERMAGEIAPSQIPIGTRYAFNFFEVFFRNLSTEEATSVTFEISINDQTQTIEWTGSVGSGEELDIQLPITSFDLEKKDENEYSITLKSINGKAVKASKLNGDFLWAQSCTPELLVEIKTNDRADDAYYRIKDADGEVVRTFGPYPSGVITEETLHLSLDPDRVYCIEVWCPWGMGLTDPNSTYVLRNDDNTLLAQVLKITDYGTRNFICTSKPSGVDQLDITHDTLHPSTDSEVYYDLSGRRISHPVKGIYIKNGKKTVIE